MTGSRDYTAFGAITAEAGAGLDRYAYTAREWDAALGLQSNRQRMYDPATGRFTSEDPSGLSAGDVNLFRYAGNAVTVFTDPSGLEGWFSENAQGLWNRFNSGLDRVADNAQGLGDRFMNGLDQLANNPEAVADRFMNGLDRVADLWNRFGNQVRHRAAEAYGKAQEACQRLRNDPLGFGEQLAEDFWARAKDFRSRFFSGWDSLGTAEGWQRAGDIYSNGASWWADQIANHPAETAADAILLYLMSRLPAVFGDVAAAARAEYAAGEAAAAARAAEGAAPGVRGMSGANPQRLLRNEEMLTPLQREEVAATARRLGISEEDYVIQRIQGSYYSDQYNVIIVGNNIYPLPGAAGGGPGVANRLTLGGAMAHENGHLVTTRAGTAFTGGSIQDEIQASIVGSRTPGLTSLERYQLLRMALEDARANGLTIQDVRALLRHGR